MHVLGWHQHVHASRLVKNTYTQTLLWQVHLLRVILAMVKSAGASADSVRSRLFYSLLRLVLSHVYACMYVRTYVCVYVPSEVTSVCLIRKYTHTYVRAYIHEQITSITIQDALKNAAIVWPVLYTHTHTHSLTYIHMHTHIYTNRLQALRWKMPEIAQQASSCVNSLALALGMQVHICVYILLRIYIYIYII